MVRRPLNQRPTLHGRQPLNKPRPLPHQAPSYTNLSNPKSKRQYCNTETEAYRSRSLLRLRIMADMSVDTPKRVKIALDSLPEGALMPDQLRVLQEIANGK